MTNARKPSRRSGVISTSDVLKIGVTVTHGSLTLCRDLSATSTPLLYSREQFVHRGGVRDIPTALSTSTGRPSTLASSFCHRCVAHGNHPATGLCSAPTTADRPPLEPIFPLLSRISWHTTTQRSIAESSRAPSEIRIVKRENAVKRKERDQTERESGGMWV